MPSTHASNINLPTLELKPGENAPDIRAFVRYKPTVAPVSISDLLQTLDDSSLLTVTEPRIDFGPAKTPLLVMLRVLNPSDEAGTWVFSTDRGSLRYIEMFERSALGTHIKLANGDIPTQQQMLKDYHAFAFQFALQPGETRLLGLVFEAETSTKLPLSIMDPRQYQSLIGTQLNIVLAATVGTLTLILLNAILFGVTGRSAFFHFVIAELALVFQAVHLSGYTTIFWFHEHAELARALADVTKILFALFSVRFIRSFLRTRETWPRFERPAAIFESICWMAIVCLAVYPFVPFLTLRLASIFSVGIVAIALIGLPLIGAVAVKRYGWIYFPLVVGWAVWGAYLIYTILTVYTPLPEFPYQWRWMAPLGFFEALMLSIALGLDIRNIQLSESRAQKNLSNALKNRLELMEATAIAKSNRVIAEQQLRETSSLVRSGGHDSRSFTGALKMYGQAIKNSKDIDKTRNYGALVSELAEQLDTTLNTLVESSPENSASLASPLRIETMDANALLDTIKRIHDHTASKAGMQIRCRTNVEEITGDRHLLIRILSNLVSNAVKYGKNGTILLTARRSGGTIALEVWDQGSGIEHEQQQRLLSPGRMRERLNPEIEGTGAGLGICRELCDKMHASLTGRSTVGSGSVFRVELCRVRPCNIARQQDIGIIDDPAHWPQEVVSSIRDHGFPVSFIHSFEEVRESHSTVVIVDPALCPRPPQEEHRYQIATCSYESSFANLGPWGTTSAIALGKPVTVDAVLFLLTLLSASVEEPVEHRTSTMREMPLRTPVPD